MHELQNLDEKCVNEILDTSEQLFYESMTIFRDKRRELYNLNFMKRILSCSTLNKRIEAIDNILIYIKQTEARERRGDGTLKQLLPYSSSSHDEYRYASSYTSSGDRGYNHQREYHANDQNINIKWLTQKRLADWLMEKNPWDIFLYGSPENGIPAHVAIARKALLGDDRKCCNQHFSISCKTKCIRY